MKYLIAAFLLLASSVASALTPEEILESRIPGFHPGKVFQCALPLDQQPEGNEQEAYVCWSFFVRDSEYQVITFGPSPTSEVFRIGVQRRDVEPGTPMIDITEDEFWAGIVESI